MSSLWTPSGEHPVDDRRGRGAPAPPPQPGEPAPAPQVDMDELRRQLAEAPAAVVVANHAYGLFELAAVYLSTSPPQLADAQLAIDALGALVEALGPRLGEAAPQLKEALAQVRLAYVQLDAAEKARLAGENGSSAEG